MGEADKKSWVPAMVAAAFVGVVFAVLAGIFGSSSTEAPDAARPVPQQPPPGADGWEQRYLAAVAALQRQCDQYFASLTTMQVDLAGAKARVEQLKAQVADSESAIGRLDEAILAAAPGGSVTALGRTYPTVDAAREVLSAWLSDYEEKQASLAGATQGRERLASSVESLKRYRAKVQQRIVGAQATFESKRAELRATQAAHEIAAMELAATRLARPGAAQDLVAVFNDLDQAILTEQQRASLVREDAEQAQSVGAPAEALRGTAEERERQAGEDLLQRLRKQRAAGEASK